MSNSEPQTSEAASNAAGWRAILWWEWVLLAAVVAAILITRFPTLDQRLLDAHGFRQTQTAIQAQYFHLEGIDLLRPIVPVLGAPWTIPFEFPLHQALASVLISWGIGTDAAMRITGLGFFIGTGLALWALLRLVTGRTIAAVSLVVFSFTPFALLWSRASLMEYLATFGAVGWLLCAVLWRRTDDWRWAVPGAVLGAIAATVKITTALAWAVPVLLVGAASRSTWRGWFKERLHAPYLALAGIPALASLAWTLHSDAVKRASDTTAWLTSSALRSWNLGTIAQRLDLTNTEVIFNRISNQIVGKGWLIVVVIGVLVIKRERLFWLAIALVPVAAVGAFFNLYFQHDYYLAAITPAIAALTGAGLVSAARWLSRSERSIAPIVIGITALWLVMSVVFDRGAWRPAYDDLGVPAGSTEIAALTEPDEYSMVFTNTRFSWSPHTLYYANRRGMMLREPPLTVDLMADQPELDRYRLLWTTHPTGPSVDYAAVRPWFAPVGPRALRLGASQAELDEATILGTTNLIEPNGEGLADLDLTDLVCDGASSVAVVHDGPMLVHVLTEGAARIAVDSDLIALPSQTRSILLPGPTTLSCHGGGTLAVEAAFAAG